jgi:hypothetical protein
MDKFKAVLEQFDHYNRQDPALYQHRGKSDPEEYFLAVQVYEWVLELLPDASEELLLAARSHHIGRWEIPRDRYPNGRIGYLTWRGDLARFHADKAADIMEKIGYEPESVARVKQLIIKNNRKSDPEAQALEDASCLVFLEFQYEDFRQKHERELVVNILRKTLLKMSPQAQEQALKLTYSKEGMELVTEAMGSLHR